MTVKYSWYYIILRTLWINSVSSIFNIFFLIVKGTQTSYKKSDNPELHRKKVNPLNCQGGKMFSSTLLGSFTGGL